MVRKFTDLARDLRKTQTPQEGTLWSRLRSKRLEGHKFYRQYNIESYIVDFCCPSRKLIIELDGGGHAKIENEEKDFRRDKDLKEKGYKILRVWNNEVSENLDNLLEEILKQLKKI